MRMGSRWGRVVRGWSAASFAIIAAAVSHTAAGGPAPTIFALGASLVIAGMLCTILAGAALSWVRLTVSIGVASVRPGDSVERLLARADEAMYRAKRAGGDAVERATDEPDRVTAPAH